MKYGITVLIPTIGREETLPMTLTSVANQIPSKGELTSLIQGIILLDEGVKPISSSYVVRAALDLLSLKGVKVKVIRNRNSEGIAKAREVLLSESNTFYSLMLDDDVVLDPFCVSRLSSALDKHIWAVPTCLLIAGHECPEGYIGRKVSSLEPEVLKWTRAYPWFIPYYEYIDLHQPFEIPYSGTQAILCVTDKFRELKGELDIGKLPREDTLMTAKTGPGLFVPRAKSYHFIDDSQQGRKNWKNSVFFALHKAASEKPRSFVELFKESGNG